jgi:membrane-associated phospholipid phosphatase
VTTRVGWPTGLTILASPRRPHKGLALACLLLISLSANELAAQQAAPHRLRPADVLLAAGAAGAYFAPHVFSLNEHPPSCAPCDPQSVPAFDRWAIAEPRNLPDLTSSGLVAALAGLEALDLARAGPSHYAEVAYVADASAWALGSAEIIKALVARKRPVLYTPDAPAEAASLESQRSFPSGHAAVAFALATSLFLVPRAGAAPLPAWHKWAALATAVTIGALRVAAAKHFPSDVVAGAALGAVSAVTVRAVRF